MSIRFNKKLLVYMFLGIGIICVVFGVIQLRLIEAQSGGHDGFILAGFLPFYWMILIVGGLIFLTLGYVSIRKYIGQKNRSKKRYKERK